MSEGTWCHIEIPCEDTDRAQKFYGECFGWTFQSVPEMGGYILYTTREGGIGGGMMKRPDQAPQQMINYVAVDTIEAAVERVENNGGTVIMPKQEVPGTGWFAIIGDPEGNSFGIWQQMQQG